MVSAKKPVTLGLIGFGNVGRGVYEIIHTNRDTIEQRLGRPVVIKTICVRHVAKYQVENIRVTDVIDDILTDPDIDIVVEVMGGHEPACDYIKRALQHKKYVVTANKDLIAKHKKTFFELAEKNGVDIFFEASVGGGIPIIKSFKVGYSANQIESVYGILNGTTNFILTQLYEEKKEFSDALKAAQDKGFAEADPTSDISGLDSAYKIVILTAVALKRNIQIEDVYYEGIADIQYTDIAHLDTFGYRVRLIAKAKRVASDSVFVAVYPTAIPAAHPLAMVRNEFNAIYSTGNMVGESMIYGKGAGSLPTGSAILSDILDIAFDSSTHRSRRNLESHLNDARVLPMSDNRSQFYMRLSVQDAPGVLQGICTKCNDALVSIKRINQYETRSDCMDVVIITDTICESVFTDLKATLLAEPSVYGVESVIRVGL
jgi:homoserine dehydrogenase